MGQPAQNADELYEAAKQQHSGRHEFRLVSPGEYPHADQRFYSRTQRQLEALGFEYLVDFADVTVNETLPFPTFARLMIGDDGTTVAAIYHIKLPLWLKILGWLRLIPAIRGRTTDFESELSDGTFVVTSNVLGADTSPVPMGVMCRRLSQRTGPEQTYSEHLASLRAVATERTGGVPRRFSTWEEVKAMADRLQDLKNVDRAEYGYLTEDEIRLAAGSTMRKATDQLIREVEEASQRD